MARTLVARIQCRTRTRSMAYGHIYEASVVKFLHLCVHAAIFISIFSDRRSLKIVNENNCMKTLTAEISYMRLGSLEVWFI